jgi:hypothetical protein
MLVFRGMPRRLIKASGPSLGPNERVSGIKSSKLPANMAALHIYRVFRRKHLKGASDYGTGHGQEKSLISQTSRCPLM